MFESLHADDCCQIIFATRLRDGTQTLWVETRKRDDDDVSSRSETNWQTKQTYYALG